MDNKYIYIVFSKTGTWLSRSIGAITKSSYTHVSLSFDTNFNNMYSFGRINPNNPFSGGLTTENIYEGVFKKSRYCQCLIYKVPVTDEQLSNLKTEVNSYFNMNKTIKFKYNFLGLFAVLLDKPLRRRYHLFCSQFISLLLKNSDIWTSPKLPELTRPTDLMKIENKTILYEGLVLNMNSYNLDFNQVSTIAL